MTIAVLGATGFIGRSLVPALAERAEVLAVSRHGDAPGGANVRAVGGNSPREISMEANAGP